MVKDEVLNDVFFSPPRALFCSAHMSLNTWANYVSATAQLRLWRIFSYERERWTISPARSLSGKKVNWIIFKEILYFYIFHETVLDINYYLKIQRKWVEPCFMYNSSCNENLPKNCLMFYFCIWSHWFFSFVW